MVFGRREGKEDTQLGACSPQLRPLLFYTSVRLPSDSIRTMRGLPWVRAWPAGVC